VRLQQALRRIAVSRVLLTVGQLMNLPLGTSSSSSRAMYRPRWSSSNWWMIGVTTRGFEAVGVFRGYLNPDQVLPAVLRRQHATSWVDDVREVTGGLLDLVLLGDEARRVFISYSRRDGAAEAEEIAAVPNERRFDVFLDRFRLAPGAGLGGTGRR
jgi:hypothetical protein